MGTAGTIAIAILLTDCSSSNAAQQATSARGSSSSAASSMPTTTTPPTPTMTSAGIVVSACAPGAASFQPPTIDVLNPTTGGIQATTSIPLTSGTFTPNVGCNTTGGLGVSSWLDRATASSDVVYGDQEAPAYLQRNMQLRSAFSPNWGYVTAISSPSSDGSKRVGIISLTGGPTIDLTAESSGSGFSAAVNIDFFTTFDQKTGDVWFARSGQDKDALYDCPTPYTTCSQKGTVSVSPQPFTIYNSQVIYEYAERTDDGYLVANPSRSLLVGSESSPYANHSWVILAPGSVDMDGYVTPVPSATQDTYSDGKSGPCNPVVWASDTSVICVDSGSSSPSHAGVFFLASGVTTGASSLTFTPLIATNSRTNSSPVPSPDGTQFAFQSQVGTQPAAIYTAPIGTVPAAPRSLPNTNNLYLFAWQ